MAARDAGERAARVIVLATGGTIASAATDGGGAVAQRTAAELLKAAGPAGVDVQANDLMKVGSYLMTHRDMRTIAAAVAAEVAREDVHGVVVTHGTDTMEETGYLLDLVHDSEKPVVLTGAQRSSDAADTDGPRNLREAITVAASPQARGCGVLISFAGKVFAAARTRKFHTLTPEPFATAGGGPIGRVSAEGVRITTRPVRPDPLPPLDERFDSVRVDVVPLYPNADAALAEAAVAAGAQAVVLAGSGAGNGNHAMLAWVREAVRTGTVVGLSTRVPDGPVVPIYGNGGAVDLVAAGALNLGAVPLFHARMLLAALLSSGVEVDDALLAPYL